jgi:hypothetical protein
MSADVKRGRPRNPVPASRPLPWESPVIATQLQEILAAVEAPPIDVRVRLTLQRKLYRSEKFGGDGRGEVTLLIRTIIESEGNEEALIEPIVSAVSICMRPEWTKKGLAWIEAFDRIPLVTILETMRSLDLFSEQSIGRYFSISIRNKLWAILEPPVCKPAPVRAKRIKRRPSPTRWPADQRAGVSA